MLGGLVDDKLEKLHPKSKASINYHFQPIISFTPYLLSCSFTCFQTQIEVCPQYNSLPCSFSL